MQIIKPSYQIIDEPVVTKKIERVARVCYKSEDKIGEGTDIKMIHNLVARQHTAMLEHASMVLEVESSDYHYLSQIKTTMETCCSLKCDPLLPEHCYMRFTYAPVITEDKMYDKRYLVSGNIRAWYNFLTFARMYGYGIQEPVYMMLMEAAAVVFEEFKDNVGVTDGCAHFFDGTVSAACLITDFSELSTEERMVHEDISILFTVDRGVTHELVRHRDCSFAQESTRYCNYSLDKYGDEITVIEPCFFARPDGVDLPTEEWAEKYGAWRAACEECEKAYFRLLDAKATPQQARDVLPTSVKADIVMTANLREWKHIFNLRACDSTGPAHPQMKEIMIPCMKELRAGKYNFAFGDMVAADEVTK